VTVIVFHTNPSAYSLTTSNLASSPVGVKCQLINLVTVRFYYFVFDISDFPKVAIKHQPINQCSNVYILLSKEATNTNRCKPNYNMIMTMMTHHV
jgi:hypothetical protein